MTAVAKYGFVFRAQHLGCSLLHEPVDHGGNSERSLLSVLLRDVYATNGRRLMPPRFDVLDQVGAVRLQVLEQFPDFHAVDAGTALVRNDGLEGAVQIVAGKYGFQIDHLVRPLPGDVAPVLSSGPSSRLPYPLDSVDAFRGGVSAETFATLA